MDSTTQNVSSLRLRMIEAMRMRKLAPKTHAAYIRNVQQFTRYLRRPPDSRSSLSLVILASQAQVTSAQPRSSLTFAS